MPAGDGLGRGGGLSARLPVSAACFAGAAIVSYTAQRLWSWYAGEPDIGTILAQAHTAYYWRVALASLHGLVAGAAVHLALDESSAARLLPWVPRWLVGAVLLSMAAMIGIP